MDNPRFAVGEARPSTVFEQLDVVNQPVLRHVAMRNKIVIEPDRSIVVIEHRRSIPVPVGDQLVPHAL